ncbi:MAG: hypothetical protein WDO16_03405 [Bacteroidota bacterium]
MSGDNTLRPYINRTVVQVKKLDNLVGDLLDITRIDNGKLRLNMTGFLIS